MSMDKFWLLMWYDVTECGQNKNPRIWTLKRIQGNMFFFRKEFSFIFVNFGITYRLCLDVLFKFFREFKVRRSWIDVFKFLSSRGFNFFCLWSVSLRVKLILTLGSGWWLGKVLPKVMIAGFELLTYR